MPRPPLHAYRIADKRRPPLDGVGALLYGGRWNSPGRRLIYASATYSGALLELLAHARIGRVPKNQIYVEVTIPAAVAIEEIRPDEVPGWDQTDLLASRAFGDRWLAEGRSAVLVVPSVVAPPEERNILINPEHAEFGRIIHGVAHHVRWDERLFKRGPEKPRAKRRRS
jgi:RES domain-containing protein